MAEAKPEGPLLTQKPIENRRLPRWSWATIIVFGLLVVAILAYFQGERAEERRSAAPILQAKAVHSSSERLGLSEAREEIIEEFFETLSRLSRDNPGMSYVELLDIALPISRELSPGPIEVDVVIENIGTRMATNVMVSVSWLGEIVGINVDALSEFETIDGGIGHELADIQIERVMIGEPVGVTVEYAAYSQAKDRLVLRMAPSVNLEFIATSYLTPEGEMSFPAFHLDVDPFVVNYDAIDVRIVSEETALEDVEVESIIASFMAAYEAAYKFPWPGD